MRPLKVARVISRRCFFRKRFSNHIIHMFPTLISASECILLAHKYTQLGDLRHLVCPDISCLPQNICSSCRCSRYRHYSTIPCQPGNCNGTFVTSHVLLLVPQLNHYRALSAGLHQVRKQSTQDSGPNRKSLQTCIIWHDPADSHRTRLRDVNNARNDSAGRQTSVRYSGVPRNVQVQSSVGLAKPKSVSRRSPRESSRRFQV